MRRSVLHVSEILVWADEHRKRTGEFPNTESGVVAVKPDEKWANLDQALRKGLRGFPGGWSLAQLFAQYRGHRNLSRLPRFTLKGILAWADAHQRQTGSWPQADDGAIHGAPGETWLAVDVALQQGGRGLPGGSSLARLLAKYRGLRNKSAPPRLSVQQILRWADAHKKRTGIWPQATADSIPNSGGETWSAINHALQRGSRGLRRKSSLSQLLTVHLGVRRHVRETSLSLEQILAWADAHKKRTGSWPKQRSGRILEAPDENWLQIAMALWEGRRGLPIGWTLPKLLAKYRDVRNIQNLPLLSESQISKWIQAYWRRHGRPPKRDAGLIPQTNGETWLAVDLALKRGTRGLQGCSSLVQLTPSIKQPRRKRS